jgi:hypothetical protein
VDAHGPGDHVRAGQLSRGTPVGPESRDGAPPVRDFVPVELLGPIARRTGSAPAAAAPSTGAAPMDPPPIPVIAADVDDGWTERTSLFGDLEG